MNIAFVGMTHLGVNSAVAAAIIGCQLVCYDPDAQLIQSLQKGLLPFVEPGLKEALLQHKENILFTSDPTLLLQQHLIYIAPDIPTDGAAVSNLAPLYDLLENIRPYIDPTAVLVIHSQVPPGFCRGLGLPRLYYHVETLIFGEALLRALHPERLIIGAPFPDEPLPQILLEYLQLYNCPILKMSYESAELTKISINLFLISSVSTTNTIASLCEKIPARWQDIALALRLDKRIGSHAYLSPGLGLAGGNLERDMATFCSLTEKYGVENSLIHSWQKISKTTSLWVLRKLYEHELLPSFETKIALLGLSYKKNSSSCKNSASVALVRALNKYSIKAYDPAVSYVGEDIEIMKTAEATFEGADLLIVMTPWDEFKDLSVSLLEQHFKGKWIIDPFGILPHKLHSIHYVTRGETYVCT